MDRPFYDFRILENAARFEFESVGKHTVRKVVLYLETSLSGVYNLVLADLLDNGELDVTTITNNNDRDTVLSTVTQTLFVFFKENPSAKVVFTGSTPARTRLYQIALMQELPRAIRYFEVQGFTNGRWELFQPNRSYDGFVISWRKP